MNEQRLQTVVDDPFARLEERAHLCTAELHSSADSNELDHVAGHDAVTGYDTRQVTVVVDPDGEVITAFPGFPDYPPGLLRRHT